MKRQEFHQKNRGKKRQNFSEKKSPSFNKRQNRRNSAVWGRFATRNCAKERSPCGENFFQSDGDDQ